MKSIAVAMFFLALSALACDASWTRTPAPDAQSFAAIATSSAAPQASPRPSATRTPAPTATTGYAATINAQDAQLAAAQSTRDALSRLQSDVTLQAIAITQQAGQWTAEAFQAREHHIAETQAAATPAAIATETQQAREDAKTARLLAVSSGLLTATAEAPAQLIAMQNAALQKQYGQIEAQATLAVQITFVVLSLLFGPSLAAWSYVLLARYVRTPYPRKREPEPAAEEAPIPVAPIARADGLLVKAYSHDTAGYAAMTAEEWPCTEAQFDELMHHIGEHDGRLIVRRFEGSASTWTRKALTGWLEWAERHNPQYVIRARDGSGYSASQTLRRIARAYGETGYSPTAASFLPRDDESRVAAARDRDARGRDGGAGEGFNPLPEGLRRLP